MDVLVALLFGALALLFMVWFVILLPFEMAQRRGRDGYVWVAISIIGTPVLAIILLLIAGRK